MLRELRNKRSGEELRIDETRMPGSSMDSQMVQVLSNWTTLRSNHEPLSAQMVVQQAGSEWNVRTMDHVSAGIRLQGEIQEGKNQSKCRRT